MVTTCACIFPSTSPRPNRRPIASAARSVASPSRDAPCASISFRSGVPWQNAMAGSRGDVARLRAARVTISGGALKPLSTRSCSMREDGVIRSVLERQLHGIRLTPLHGPRGPERRSLIEHRLIQIRGNDRDAFWQHRSQSTSHDACAGRYFQHATERSRCEPVHQVRGVRLEEQGNQIRVVKFRNRAGEDLVSTRTTHSGGSFGSSALSRSRIARAKTSHRLRVGFRRLYFAIARRAVRHESIEEGPGRLRHLVYRSSEGGFVDSGRPGEAAQFSDELERRRPYLLLRGRRLEIVQRFDASAHARSS